MIEIYKALGVKMHVEIYDKDMAETIWPMSDEHEDEGFCFNSDLNIKLLRIQ